MIMHIASLPIPKAANNHDILTVHFTGESYNNTITMLLLMKNYNNNGRAITNCAALKNNV